MKTGIHNREQRQLPQTLHYTFKLSVKPSNVYYLSGTGGPLEEFDGGDDDDEEDDECPTFVCGATGAGSSNLSYPRRPETMLGLGICQNVTVINVTQ